MKTLRILTQSALLLALGYLVFHLAWRLEMAANEIHQQADDTHRMSLEIHQLWLVPKPDAEDESQDAVYRGSGAYQQQTSDTF